VCENVTKGLKGYGQLDLFVGKGKDVNLNLPSVKNTMGLQALPALESNNLSIWYVTDLF